MLQTKTKSIILISTVLLLGIILGGLSARYLIDSRIKNFERMRHPEGFAHVFDRMLNLSDEQTEAVQEVMEKHHERFLLLSTEHMAQIQEEMDLLREELSPYLTDDQIDRLVHRMSPPGPGRKHGRGMGEHSRNMERK